MSGEGVGVGKGLDGSARTCAREERIGRALEGGESRASQRQALSLCGDGCGPFWPMEGVLPTVPESFLAG